jgi:hypothetical protein
VDFGELNDKAIKGLMILSKIVSRLSLYIHEQPLKYLIMNIYYGSQLQRQIYGARLHEVIEREQDDECTHYGSKIGSLHIRCPSRSSIWSKAFQMKG